MLKTSMELGGNAPFLVFADADVDAAVEGALVAKMRNIGEACTAANRFHVASSIADEFAEKLAAKLGEWKVGRGTEEGVQVGPLIDATQRDKVAELVDDATGKGADVLLGGGKRDGAGYFYDPTVLAGVPGDARLLKEEIFGPVAPVIAFDDEDAAIAAANDTEYGLVSYVYTKDLKRAFRVCEQLDTGMIGLNQGLVANVAGAVRRRQGLRPRPRGRQGRHRRVPGDQVHRDGDVSDPLEQFSEWYEHAVAAGLPEPEAMALATATPDGAPSVRFVLLKGIDERGVEFFTNYESRKGRELAREPARLAGDPVEAPPAAGAAGGAGRGPDAARSPTSTSRAARAARSSAPGPHASPRRSRTATGWRTGSPRWTRATRREVPRPPHWGGFRLRAAHDRVLGGPPEPPARPRGVHARRRRRLAFPSALALAPTETRPRTISTQPHELQQARVLREQQRAQQHRADRLDRQDQRRHRRRQARERDGDQHPAEHLRGEREHDQPAGARPGGHEVVGAEDEREDHGRDRGEDRRVEQQPGGMGEVHQPVALDQDEGRVGEPAGDPEQRAARRVGAVGPAARARR